MSWIIIKGLKEQRAAVGIAAKKLVEVAGAEKRTLTGAEDATFNKLTAEHDNLTNQITVHEMQDSEARSAAQRSRTANDNGETRALRKDERARDYLKIRGIDSEDIGIGSYIRAMIVGPANDNERRALDGGFRAGSNSFALPASTVADALDGIRSLSVVMRAGAQVIPLIDDRNRVLQVSSEPTAATTGEGVSVTASSNFTSVAFTPAVARGIVVVSRESIQDSVDVNGTVGQSIYLAIARQFDASALSVLSGSSGSSVAVGGAFTDYNKIMLAVRTLLDNYTTPNAMIFSPRDSIALASLADTTGQPMRKSDLIANVPQYASTALTASTAVGYVGDFARLMIGARTSIEIAPLVERYADTHSVGLAYSLRYDAVLQRPKSVVKLTGITA